MKFNGSSTLNFNSHNIIIHHFFFLEKFISNHLNSENKGDIFENFFSSVYLIYHPA